MTEKEAKVESCKLDVKCEESRVREAQHDLTEGQKDGADSIKQAKAEAARENDRLKECLERAKIALEKERINLKAAEAELERGFDA